MVSKAYRRTMGTSFYRPRNAEEHLSYGSIWWLRLGCPFVRHLRRRDDYREVLSQVLSHVELLIG